MAGRVSIGGDEMTVEAAIDVLVGQIAALKAGQPLAAPSEQGQVLQALNATLEATAARAQARPNFDLVSTLEPFDGEHPEKVGDFFQSLEGVGTLSNWGDAEKLRIALLKVTGSAARFIKSVEKEKLETYDQLKATLTDRFSEKLPRDSYFQQLSVIQQRVSEPVEAFADRVRALNEKTIRITNSADVNCALREEANRRALDAFLRGLHGPVGDQTRLKFPTTMDEALTTAIAVEHLLNRASDSRTAGRESRRVFWAQQEVLASGSDSRGRDRPHTSPTPSGQFAAYESRTRSSSRDHSKERPRDYSRDRGRDLGRNRDQNRSRERGYSRNSSRDRGGGADISRGDHRVHGSYRQQNEYRTRPTYPRRDLSGTECWWCRRRGHVQAACFARMAYEDKNSRWKNSTRNPRGPGQQSGNGSGVPASAAGAPQKK